jgi:elongation factor P
MIPPTELRRNDVILYQSAPHVVVETQHRTQGRQAGFVQATLRNLESGSSTACKFRSTDRVEILDTEMKKLEFSFQDGDGYHFMNPSTYEDTVLPAKYVQDAVKFLLENHVYDILYVDGKPIQVTVPAIVEMKVVEAPEGLKGDTASAPTKPAKTETGVVVMVPLFVKAGDVIRVNTDSGNYLGRA